MNLGKLLQPNPVFTNPLAQPKNPVLSNPAIDNAIRSLLTSPISEQPNPVLDTPLGNTEVKTNTASPLPGKMGQNMFASEPTGEGKVIKAYHGTNNEFDVFDEGKFNTVEPKGDYTGQGFYFSNTKETAQKYAKQAVAKLGGKEIVKEVSLDIKNPFVINSQEDIAKFNDIFHTEEAMSDIPKTSRIDRDKLKELGYARMKLIKENPKAVVDKLKSLGYDGLIDNLYGQKIVFNKEQIKLSTPTGEDKLETELKRQLGAK